MHILYLTHHSWPFPNRVMAFNFGICLAVKSTADRIWCIQQSWRLREQNKGMWLGKAYRGNKETKEETIATSQKYICEHINFLLITVRRLRDRVPVTTYFRCHPVIIPSSHRHPVFQNLQTHTMDTAPPAVKVKLSVFPVHILLSNGSSIQRLCIATSFFHQPVIFQRYRLLFFRPKCLWRDLCCEFSAPWSL